MTNEEITEILQKRLKPTRFKHTLGVAETAVKLAEKYGADKDKAYLAGLLHDCAKNIDFETSKAYCKEHSVPMKEICMKERSLIHAPLGAYMAKEEFGVSDPEILTAIYYHTTGHEDMALLTKILYMADAVEPNRDQDGIEEIRELAFSDINEALIRSIDATLLHIINKGVTIDCDTIKARNFLIEERNAKTKPNC
ncbi:MAG: bis(5'-nucleosyl)-tetraphosphatase (symmetrical) YqeK [Clostridia bacterium]|nr:bis(5'-nucleosyl)-tetraphosphatase (symmetrical) YqeK [Clostridia bacterium]